MVRFAKKISSVIISVLIITMTFMTVSASENYKNWTQGDYRWASKPLGSCGDTMSEIGCAVTSIAILAAHSQSASPDEFNPGTLCDYLNENNGFDSNGNLYWAAVSGLVPDFGFTKKASISVKTEKAIASQLANYINQGYYVVLSVRYDGHWVAIDTVTDGEVYMIDPAQNKVHKLFDYYDTDGMLQVRLYRGKVAPQPATTGESDVTYFTGHYQTTSALNLRASYDTSAEILTTIPANTIVVATRIYDNLWGQVEYNGKTGWVYLEYTDYIESSYTYKSGNYKVNEQGGVYLRNSIGTQSTAKCLVPYNTVVKIDTVTANWGRTSYNGQTGWVCMEYLTYSSPATTTTAVTTKVTTTTKTTTSSAVSTTITESSEQIDINNLVKGDINEDGIFTGTDLILLNEYIAEPVYLTYTKRYIMDVNNDYTIDERDSVYLFKIINKGN